MHWSYRSHALRHQCWVSFMDSKRYLHSDFSVAVIYAVWSYNSLCPIKIRRHCWSVCMYTYDYCHDWLENVQDIITNLYIYLVWVEKETAMYHGISNNSDSAVCTTGCSCLNQRNIKTLYYWPFVRGIQWWLMDSPDNGPVMQKVFPWHDIIMVLLNAHIVMTICSCKFIAGTYNNLK